MPPIHTWMGPLEGTVYPQPQRTWKREWSGARSLAEESEPLTVLKLLCATLSLRAVSCKDTCY